MADRWSDADEPVIVSDPKQRAALEASNSVAQFDLVKEILRRWLANPNRRLKPSDVLNLHRVLLDGLSVYAGLYRPATVKISGSRHRPPTAQEVAGFVEDLCEYLSLNWNVKTSVHLAAYALWRVNWIHPFSDGNGRTARAVSYLVLCAHSGSLLPGDLTVPEQIQKNKTPYYDALEAADRELLRGGINLVVLETFLNTLLANQLYDFYRSVSGDDRTIEQIPAEELQTVLNEAKRSGAEDRHAVMDDQSVSAFSIIKWIEKHPAFTTGFATLLTAVVAWFLTKFG